MDFDFKKITEEITKDSFKVFEIPEFKSENKVKKHIVSEMPDHNIYVTNKIKLQNKETSSDGLCINEPLLTKQQEFHVFRKMHYYKYNCRNLYKKYCKNKNGCIRKKIIESYCRFQELRHLIHQCNLKLVSQSLKKRRDFYGSNNLDDLFSDAFMNILKAVDSFDYRRGIKFSTYACWCLLNNSLRDHQGNKRFELNNSSNCEIGVFEKPNDEKSFLKIENDESGFSDWNKIKDYFLKKDKAREMQIIEKVFGLNGQEEKTIAEIASEFNLTKERIRQLREKTLNEIKSCIKIGRIKVDGMSNNH